MELTYSKTVKLYDVLEIVCKGKSDGNPFVDYSISASIFGADSITVKGFYDGNGTYIVRYMPQKEGEYSFKIFGSFSDETEEGSFKVEGADEHNHGMVSVANQYHFTYADGTPYYSVGTTCYVWHLQGEEQKKETLESLVRCGFNKIRFCIFPKHYAYNFAEPPCYPFEGTPVDSSGINMENFNDYNGCAKGNAWDFTKFNPEYFRNIEECILSLRNIGVEADIILFHPYDRWGFSWLTREQSKLYLEYVAARFSAYSNVWWSFANEYDLLPNRTTDDWNSYAKVIMDNDPYNHLRSIHNCMDFFDHKAEWVTHCSIQRQDVYKTVEYTNEWREQYGKPVVLDEISYEGNMPYAWGNITAEEMVRRFWETVCRGGYAGHSETYLYDTKDIWWSHGGRLYGESCDRMKFLLKIMSETPGHGLKAGNGLWDEVMAVPEDEEAACETGYRLYYYSFMRPAYREYQLDDDCEYEVEVIDTWNMTITYVGRFSGKFRVELPSQQYIAVRMRKAI